MNECYMKAVYELTLSWDHAHLAFIYNQGLHVQNCTSYSRLDRPFCVNYQPVKIPKSQTIG